MERNRLFSFLNVVLMVMPRTFMYIVPHSGEPGECGERVKCKKSVFYILVWA